MEHTEIEEGEKCQFYLYLQPANWQGVLSWLLFMQALSIYFLSLEQEHNQYNEYQPLTPMSLFSCLRL